MYVAVLVPRTTALYRYSTVLYWDRVAVDFHYEVDLSYFLSKWSKIKYFRPENDPFTRLGLQ
jgi:hypothetical protein